MPQKSVDFIAFLIFDALKQIASAAFGLDSTLHSRRSGGLTCEGCLASDCRSYCSSALVSLNAVPLYPEQSEGMYSRRAQMENLLFCPSFASSFTAPTTKETESDAR